MANAHGQYYNAQVVDFEDGNPVYKKDEEAGKYVVAINVKNQNMCMMKNSQDFFLECGAHRASCKSIKNGVVKKTQIEPQLLPKTSNTFLVIK